MTDSYTLDSYRDELVEKWQALDSSEEFKKRMSTTAETFRVCARDISARKRLETFLTPLKNVYDLKKFEDVSLNYDTGKKLHFNFDEFLRALRS